MSDLRRMMRNGQVQLGPDAQVVIDGHLVRSDGTRQSKPPIESRRSERRRRNRQARAARRHNRS